MDLLSPERQEIFERLSVFKNQFVLAGGTAIMLQIGHRLSFDFDCFIEGELPPTIKKKATKIFQLQGLPRVNTPEQFTFISPQKIEITFVSHPYPLLRKPIPTHSLPLFHLDDLAANKANVIGRRNTWRDYVDIFILLKWKLYSIDQLIALANKKFAGEFHDKLFLQQLCYFTDIPIVPTNFVKDSYSDKEIQSFLSTEVERYVKKVLNV